MTGTLDKLTQDVTDNKSATDSAVALLTNLTAMIKAAGTDPVALKALTDSLEANTQALSSAITANTPTPS